MSLEHNLTKAEIQKIQKVCTQFEDKELYDFASISFDIYHLLRSELVANGFDIQTAHTISHRFLQGILFKCCHDPPSSEVSK